MASSPTPTKSSEAAFTGPGGLKIAFRHWGPPGPARAVVVICHGFNAHAGQYQCTVGGMIAVAKSAEPGAPVFLMGHSAGGVTAVTYALDHQAEIAGLICESFA